MQSLADFLGARDRDLPDHVPEPQPRATNLSIQERAREILSSPEYFQSVLDRLRLGEFPPQMEVLLHHYAYGKPVERVEVKDTTAPLEEVSLAQLKSRAATLLNLIAQLEGDEDIDVTVREVVH